MNKWFDGERVLFIGAHADDIELGCGGLIHQLGKREIETFAVVFTCRPGENYEVVERETKGALFRLSPLVRLDLYDMPGRFLHNHRDVIRQSIISTARTVRPSIVFTHCLDDRHQDHVTVAEETRRVFRAETLFEYECPASSRLSPNVFVGLIEPDIDAKVEALERYESQAGKRYFSRDVLFGLAAFRGAQSWRFPLAEAFSTVQLSI
jgi:LmbE family N-acetylglucosaminyl deacetylase